MKLISRNDDFNDHTLGYDERHRVEEEDNFDTGLERDESGDESGDDNFEEEDW